MVSLAATADHQPQAHAGVMRTDQLAGKRLGLMILPSSLANSLPCGLSTFILRRISTDD